MKIIILLFGSDALSQDNQFHIPAELVDKHDLFLASDRSFASDRAAVITIQSCQPTSVDELTPPGAEAALHTLSDYGHIRPDEAVAVLDGHALERAMPRLNEAIASYKARDELPVISVAPATDHPCTWVHLNEIVSVDLVGFFDYDYIKTFSSRSPVPVSHISKALPGPWYGETFGADEHQMCSISPSPLSFPEDLLSTLKDSGGVMDFIREGDLCRRVFQDTFILDGDYAVTGCSLLYPADSCTAYLITAPGGQPCLFLDTRFIESGDSVRVVPMQGNMMADDLTIETGVPISGKILNIDGLGGVVSQAVELDCTLPQGNDIDGYLITVLRSHQGKRGDIEQFFTPVPGLWGQRVFPGKRYLYNLLTGEQIQGRQQYPEVLTPSRRLYVGTMEQLPGLCTAEELGFIEVA